MAILSKTVVDYEAALGYRIGPAGIAASKTYNMVYQQIVPPNLYCIVSAVTDGHIETWSVTP